MAAASRGGRGPYGRQFLGRRLALEGEREALVVVPRLPLAQRDGRGLKVRELLSTPKLLVIDAVAPLHLAVLLRAPGADVPMPDPRRLHGQRELERKLPPVVALEAPNGKGEGTSELVQKGQAGPVVQPPVQPQDTEPRAIIQGRVLKRPPSRNFDKLDVDLDGLPGLGFFEQLELPGGRFGVRRR